MQLRILVGSDVNRLLGNGEAPPTRYRSPQLVVQASADIPELAMGARERLLIAGTVIGTRADNGTTQVVDPGLRDVAELVRREGFPKAQGSLEGSYLLVWIHDDGSATVGTDAFGQRELYYQQVNGATVLGTDLSLLPVSRTFTGYDQTALAHVLCVYGYRPPKRHTYYRDVRRLGVTEWVRLRDGRMTIEERHFQPVTTGAYGARELEEYADLLLEAVRIRGSRHGNVVYLSSGWDSTAILACLVQLFGSRKVRAVIGRMQYAVRSGVINQFEIERAKAVADFFGVRLDIVEFDYRQRVPEVLERLQPWLRSRQVASMTSLSHGLLAEFVARTSSREEVVFAGEISDGAHNLGFSQFVTIFHPVLEFREYSDKMGSYLYGPTFLQSFLQDRFADDPIYGLLRGRCGQAIFDTLASTPGQRATQLLASFFLRATRVPLWSLRNARTLTDAGRALYSEEMERTYLAHAADTLTPQTLYAWYLHLYNSFHWQGSTVATMPVTTEAFGMRMALPFWDGRLQEFLSAMPESWGRGLDLHPTKYPLKWALTHRIRYPMHLQVGPHSYLYDVDSTFSHAAEVLYGSAFAPYFKGQLKRREYRSVLDEAVFDLPYLDSLVERYLNGEELRGAERNDVMTLCIVSMVGWYGAVNTIPGRSRARSPIQATVQRRSPRRGAKVTARR